MPGSLPAGALNTTMSPRCTGCSLYDSLFTRTRSCTFSVGTIDSDGMKNAWNKNVLISSAMTSASTTRPIHSAAIRKACGPPLFSGSDGAPGGPGGSPAPPAGSVTTGTGTSASPPGRLDKGSTGSSSHARSGADGSWRRSSDPAV